MNDKKYVISSTPHVRSNDSIESIMKNVLIALIPAVLVANYVFGLRAGYVMLLTMASCYLSEYYYCKLVKKPVTTGDYSALVTGLLLAMNLPASVPFYVPILGGMFAIIIVKMLFGGLGQNFVNPALAARAFLQISFPTQMVAWTEPINSVTSLGIDAVSTATPLRALALDEVPVRADYMDALLGSVAGSLGETCAIAIILGGLFLLSKKIITWRIPLMYLGTFGVLAFIFGKEGFFTGQPIYEMLIGGILLGAFFMATDYSSSPITEKGQLIMGFGCGLLTFLIRHYGGYPEGVCYSILIMNLTVPLIDKYVKPKVYGVSKEVGKHA